MNLHEYQGKQLFAEYGLPVSNGIAVDTPEAAAEAALKIVVPYIDKASTKGVIHKSTASRKISRLNKLMNTLG